MMVTSVTPGDASEKGKRESVELQLAGSHTFLQQTGECAQTRERGHLQDLKIVATEPDKFTLNVQDFLFVFVGFLGFFF